MNHIKKIFFFILSFTIYSNKSSTLIKHIIHSGYSKKNNYQKREYAPYKIIVCLNQKKKNLNKVKYPQSNFALKVYRKHNIKNVMLALHLQEQNMNTLDCYKATNFLQISEDKRKSLLRQLPHNLKSSLSYFVSSIFSSNKKICRRFLINDFFKKNMIWFLKWVTVKPKFPGDFFEESLEKILFENNISPDILAKMGRKNFNIFRQKNNTAIEKYKCYDFVENEIEKLLYYKSYKDALKRQDELDEIEIFIMSME